MKKNAKETSNMNALIQNMMTMMQAQLGGTGETSLMLAAAAGDIERMSREANIETQDQNGFTALMHAAAKGNLKAVRLLVEEFNANVNTKNTKRETALDLAVNGGHIAVAGYLKNKSSSEIVFKKNADGITPLMSACVKGDLKAVRWLIGNGAEKDEKDSSKDQKTPIMHALAGNIEVIRYLVEIAKVNTAIADSSGNSLLDQAVMRGDLPIVRYLKGKVAASYHNRAFLCAISNGRIQIVDYFIREKINIDLKVIFSSETEKFELPLLCYAMYMNQREIFEYLIGKGTNINAEFKMEKINDSSKKLTGTVMAWALSCTKKENGFIDFLMRFKPIVKYDGDKEVFSPVWFRIVEEGNIRAVQWLLSQKKEIITEKTKSGETILLLAANRGHSNIALYALAMGAQIEEKDAEGFTALLHAAMCGHLQTAQDLIEIGRADIQTENNDGDNAIAVAAWNGHTQVIECLKDHGGDINYATKPRENTPLARGDTPLMLASENGKLETVRWLLKNGSEINTPNLYKMSALILAARKGRTDIVKELCSAGASLFLKNIYGFTALERAAANEHKETVAYLLSVGANSEVEKDSSYTQLHRFVAYEPEKAKSILQKSNAEINLQTADVRGNTLLHYAAGFGTLEILKLLLNLNAVKDLETRNHHKYTPLHMAIFRSGKEVTEIIKLLLSKGADPNSTDSKGNTLLHTAIDFNLSLEVIELLVSAGVKVRLANDAGKTPFDIAKVNKNTKVMEFLQEQEKIAISAQVVSVNEASKSVEKSIVPTSAWEKASPATTVPNSTFFADQDMPPLTSTEEEVIKDGKKEEKGFG